MCEDTNTPRTHTERVRAMRRDAHDACAAYYRSIHREPTSTEQALLLACVTSLE